MKITRKRGFWIALAVLAVPVLALAWWLGSPLFIDSEVGEAFPLSAGAEVPAGMTQADVENEMAEAAAAPAVEAGEDMPGGAPVALADGSFRDADDFHQGSGTATIYELPDGARFLRLEDFRVTNGPDLRVLLVPSADPMTRAEVEGYVDLGSLKGNIGDQNYEIPDGLELSGFGSVVIYCRPFHVLFSVASLST